MSEKNMVLIGMIPVGAKFRDGGQVFTLDRHHRGAPKGKVCICRTRDGGGVQMKTFDDTERFEVIG